jgi:hypothetical protein
LEESAAVVGGVMMLMMLVVRHLVLVVRVGRRRLTHVMQLVRVLRLMKMLMMLLTVEAEMLRMNQAMRTLKIKNNFSYKNVKFIDKVLQNYRKKLFFT